MSRAVARMIADLEKRNQKRWAPARALIENHQAIPAIDRAWLKTNGYDVDAAIRQAEIVLCMEYTYR